MASKKHTVIETEKKITEKKKYKWTKKKIIAAAILSVAAVAFMVFMIITLTSDSGVARPIKSSEEEARIVGQCGDYKIRYEEVRCVTHTCRSELERSFGKYDELDSEGKIAFEAELDMLVHERIEKNYAILTLCNKLGIDTDSKDVRNYVQGQVEKLISENCGGSKKQYKVWLAENKMTDSFCRFMFKLEKLETMLLEKIVSEKIGVEYTSDNKNDFINYVLNSGEYARTIHVYYPEVHPWSDRNNVPEEILAVDEEYIESIVSRYDAESNIVNAYAAVIDQSDTDKKLSRMRSAIGATPITEYSVSGNGFLFTYGQMGEKYETLTFALDDYGVSEIFEYMDGYCFIMRLPLLEDDVRKNVDDYLYRYQYLVLTNQLDNEAESLSIEINGDVDLIEIQ